MTRLKEIRIKKGFTQTQVAQMLNCSTTVYSRYETGDRQPSIDVLISLSQIFNVSIDYIVNNPREISSSIAPLSELDTELLHRFHAADQYDQIAVLRTLKIPEER